MFENQNVKKYYTFNSVMIKTEQGLHPVIQKLESDRVWKSNRKEILYIQFCNDKDWARPTSSLFPSTCEQLPKQLIWVS